MLQQSTLEKIVLCPKDFGILKMDEGVPSAHDPKVKYYPRFDGERWLCEGPNGPCEHFRRYGTPCRHIFQKKFENVKELYDHICEKVEYSRDIRDLDCQSFDEVITYVSMFRGFEMNKLATLMLSIAVMRGQVSTDDLHDATNEQYADDRIVGTVTGALIREKFIEEIGRVKTKRRCAHGRKIGIYTITEDGFDYLRMGRLEPKITT